MRRKPTIILTCGQVNSNACSSFGVIGCGTVFEISPGGSLTTLHSFDSIDGSGSTAPLVQATDGNFYGTTGLGGSSASCLYGCGTIFEITPRGTLTTLHSFDSTDGSDPRVASFKPLMVTSTGRPPLAASAVMARSFA